MSCLTANSMATRARSTFGVRGQSGVSGNIVIGELVELIPQLPYSGESGNIYGYLLKVRPDTNWHASQEIGQDGCVTAYMTNSMSSYGGGTIALPRIGEEVVIVSSSGGSSNPYMYIGALHGKIYPWPFNGDADQASNSALTGTGFRVPDLVISPTESELPPDANTNEYAKLVSAFAPGSSPSKGLLDENLFFHSAGFYATKKDKDKKDVKVETREATLDTAVKSETCSDPFGNAQRALEGCSDSAYQSGTTKGYGFNEIMIRSRQASGSKPDDSGQYTQWSTEGKGGISLYGQDYVDQWSTGTMSMQSLGNMAVGSGEVLNIEAGREINLRVGRSGITINQSGVTISQNDCGTGGYATTLELSNYGISTFAPMFNVECNFCEMTTGWSTFTMTPGTLTLDALFSASMRTGAQYAFPFPSSLESLAESITEWTDLKKQYPDTYAQSRSMYWGMSMLSELLAWPTNPGSAFAFTENVLPAVDSNKNASAVEIAFEALESAYAIFESCKTGRSLGPTNVSCQSGDVNINAGEYLKRGQKEWTGNGHVNITATAGASMLSGSTLAARVEGCRTISSMAIKRFLVPPIWPGICLGIVALKAVPAVVGQTYLAAFLLGTRREALQGAGANLGNGACKLVGTHGVTTFANGNEQAILSDAEVRTIAGRILAPVPVPVPAPAPLMGPDDVPD